MYIVRKLGPESLESLGKKDLKDRTTQKKHPVQIVCSINAGVQY